MPVVLAWVLILGVVALIAANPHLLAPLASRLLSRHLLQNVDGQLRLRDFRIRSWEGADVYDVSLTLRGDRGAVTLIAVDTLAVDFRWGEMLRRTPRLRRVDIQGCEIYALAGEPEPARISPPPDLASLPRLQIDSLRIGDASLELSGPDGRLRERITRFDWLGSIGATDSLVVASRNADLAWETRDSRLSNLRGRVVADRTGISTTGLSGTLNDVPVQVVGRRDWDGRIALDVETDGSSTAEVANLLDLDLGVRARGRFAAGLSTSGDTVRLDGTFTGELEDYELDSVRAVAVVTPDSLKLPSVQGRINSAWFAGTGAFELRDSEQIAFVLDGEVADVDLSRGLVPGGADLPVTDGRGHVRIVHDDAGGRVTEVRGVLRDGSIAPLPFDSCWVDVSADTGGVDFHRLALERGGWSAVLTGHADPSEVFAGSLEIVADDLRAAPPQWDWPELGGAAVARGRLAGPPDSLEFRGWLSGRALAYRGIAAQRAEIALVADDVLGDPLFTFGADGDGLVVGGVPLGRYLLWGAVSARAARIDSFRTVRGDTTVSLVGEVAFGGPVRNLRLERFGFGLEGSHWRLTEPVAVEFGPDQLAVPTLELVSERGRLIVQGVYEAETVAAASLQLRQFDLGLLNPLLGTGDLLKGEATAEVVVAGTPQQPLVELDATLTGLQFDLADVDTASLSASYSKTGVDIAALRLVTNHGLATVQGTIANPDAPLATFWPGAALDLECRVSDGDWAVLEPLRVEALDRLAGRFSSRFHCGGTTDDPLIVGELASAPFHIHWVHLDSLRGEVLVDRDALVLSRLRGRKGDLPLEGRLEVPLDFALSRAPAVDEDGPFFARLVVPAGTDLTALADATNAFLVTGGRGALDLEVSGPLLHPSYRGAIAIDDGEFVLRDLEEVYRECTARGVFNGDVLRVDELRGREGLRGTFSGGGSLYFDGLDLRTFDLTLAVDRFLVASIPDLRVLVRSPAVRLEGVRVGPDNLLVPKFSGQLEVLKARYTGNFSGNGESTEPLLGTVAPDWLAELRLQGPPRSARIVNRAMELDLSGDVTLVRDLSGMDLRGGLVIDAGWLPVFNNTFKVVRGDLDFSRGVGVTPYGDIDAETRVRLRSQPSNTTVIEKVTVHVQGPMDEPEISFSSESGFSREGIERMLLGLSPEPAADDANRLRNTSIAAGFNLLEREVAQELDIVDTFEIEQINRTTDGSTGFDPLIGVGKYLGQDLYIKYAQGLSQNDRDLLIEYQISDHLLLQSEIRRRLDEFQGEDTYNLDLKYRIEY
jgi:hypothetical protein